jgi:thiol-disulfide isomerase/thioredoxin
MNTKKIYTDGKNEQNNFSLFYPSFSSLISAFFCFSLIYIFAPDAFAQTKESKQKTSAPKIQAVSNLPKVTQIDAPGLKSLLKANGKPLLINFWATWCDPCREEFPDLVKIAVDYKDKIDLITVSLDELSEINGDVPKFLAEMKSESPAYLLKTPDEGAAIGLVSKEWQGALPFTILFNGKGETVYSKQGKFKTDLLRTEIEKTLTAQNQITNSQTAELPIRDLFWDLTYEKGKTDAAKDIAEGKLIIRRYGLTRLEKNPKSSKRLKEKYSIEYIEHGCIVTSNLIEYVKGYNEISKAEIKRRFGTELSPITAKK